VSVCVYHTYVTRSEINTRAHTDNDCNRLIALAVAEAVEAADEGREIQDVSSVLTIAKRDWPAIVRKIS
jgi:hypothetical protein